MPDWTELSAEIHVVSLPMRHGFRGLTQRETLLLRGPVGWTEWAPFVEYDDEESSTWLRAAIEYGWENLEIPLERVPVNATVPAVPAHEVAAVLERFAGVQSVKVKVAQVLADGSVAPLAEDVDRVRAVREELVRRGLDDVLIRVDANGAWSVAEAEAAVAALSEFGLDYIEQPCASVEELALLRQRVAGSGVRIAADESVRRSRDPLDVARANAADLLVIKAAPLGGIRQAEAIVDEAGLPVVVSSALESSIGLGMGAALAARLAARSTGNTSHTQQNASPAGLGTAELFSTDVCVPSRQVIDGHVSTARIEPDAEALTQLAVSPDRRNVWLDRLRRSFEHLQD